MIDCMTLSRLEDAIVGGVSAVFAGCFTIPLEVVKVRLQLLGSNGKPLYNGILHAFSSIYKGEGFRGFYTGLPSFAMYQFVLNGVRLSTYMGMFTVFDKIDKSLSSNEKSIPPVLKSLCAGGAAGLCGAVLGNPLSIVKTRQQKIAETGGKPVYPQGFMGIFKILSNAVRHEGGIKALFRGLDAAAPRIFLGSAVQLATFELIKQEFAKVGLVGPITNAGASFCAAIGYAFATAPLDMIATRIYATQTTNNSKNAYQMGLHIFRNEGFLVFYRGALPIFMRHGPHTTLMLTTWEELRRLYSNIVYDKSSKSYIRW